MILNEFFCWCYQGAMCAFVTGYYRGGDIYVACEVSSQLYLNRNEIVVIFASLYRLEAIKRSNTQPLLTRGG
jgi:hypothetical protein